MREFHFRSLEIQEVSCYIGELHDVLTLRVYSPPSKRTRARFIMRVVLVDNDVEIVGDKTISAGSLVSGWGYISDFDETKPIKTTTILVRRIKIERR